jgi:hypothetical protein
MELEPFAFIDLHCKNVKQKYISILFYLMSQGNQVNFSGYKVDTIINGLRTTGSANKLEFSLHDGATGVDTLASIPITLRSHDTVDVNVFY